MCIKVRVLNCVFMYVYIDFSLEVGQCEHRGLFWNKLSLISKLLRNHCYLWVSKKEYEKKVLDQEWVFMSQ